MPFTEIASNMPHVWLMLRGNVIAICVRLVSNTVHNRLDAGSQSESGPPKSHYAGGNVILNAVRSIMYGHATDSVRLFCVYRYYFMRRWLAAYNKQIPWRNYLPCRPYHAGYPLTPAG